MRAHFPPLPAHRACVSLACAHPTLPHLQVAKKADVDGIIAFLNAGDKPAGLDVAVFPSCIHLAYVKASLRGDIIVGAQNVFTAKGLGAYTGEQTAELLLDSEIDTTLVGHSERRSILGESNAFCGEKAQVALCAGMRVVFCIGETLAQREAGSTMEVVTAQLGPLVSGLDPSYWPRVVIAYEPVWAIGTGKVATSDQVQEVHSALRGWLSSAVTPEVAAAVRIIYGGSVKGSNCAELATLPDVDGAWPAC